MLPVLTAQAMHELDAAAVARDGEVELMRRAGKAIAQLVRAMCSHGRIVALAGYGNNGGDALAALAELDASYERIAIAFDPGERVSDARRDALARARARGVTIIAASDAARETYLTRPHFFLDGLLGVGARAGMSDDLRRLTGALNRSGGTVLALDVPTGVDATTGVAEDDAVVAAATIAIGAMKLGLLLEPARPYVGALWLDDIGMSAPALATSTSPEYFALDEASAHALLPRRKAEGDKRTSGAPLVIAGSEQFPGAAVLCTHAAARAGAGYVTLATPRSAAQSIRAHLIEQVVVPFDESNSERATQEILDVAKRCSSIAIGPGLGLDENIGTIVRSVISATSLPLVIDASGLFHLAKHLDILRGKLAVLTPHAGEFARLSGGGSVTPTTRLTRLRAFVGEHGIVTLLKGQATLIDDGRRVAVNVTGTSALATAGTGDVLTGIIATLLAQGLSPFDAATLGAYWHGLAGQFAARQRPIGVIAGDLPEVLADSAPQRRTLSAPLRIF
ncbi:MAG TPA: NAD(P)H-hydrate dehydratase [Candidatus Baltobacteraceae bacterium]